MGLQDQIAIVTGATSGFGADGLRCTDTERSNWARGYETQFKQEQVS